jgi:endo-1,4-beta-xylanase
MDVQIHDLPGSLNDELREQATIYGEMAAACRAAGNCHYFVTWGVSDRYSWLQQVLGYADAPLLFDTKYRPKPAYYAVRDALRSSEPSS